MRTAQQGQPSSRGVGGYGGSGARGRGHQQAAPPPARAHEAAIEASNLGQWTWIPAAVTNQVQYELEEDAVWEYDQDDDAEQA